MNVLKLAYCSVSLLCAALPASGQWQRVVYSGKGEFSDIPSQHPLSYFTANPFLRDDGSDLCRLCTPEDKAKSAREFSIRTAVEPLGVIAGYRILDVLYHVSARKNPNHDRVTWKSILVRVGPDRYKEIFHLQAFYTTVSLSPSKIIQSGKEAVLGTMDRDGGNGGGCWEGYWWFDHSGPHSLDFSSLRPAVQAAVPKKATFGVNCESLDLASEQVRAVVQESGAECHACGYFGEVIVRFHLDGPIVKPLTVTFRPWNAH